jgi:hypothetical protein
VLTVICTNRNSVKIQRLIVYHFLTGIVALNTLNLMLFEECLCFAGDNICACDDLYVGLLKVRSDMSICDPTGTDDTYAKLLGSINNRYLLGFFECVKNVCHYNFLLIIGF